MGSDMGYRSTVAYTIRFTGEHDEKVKQSFYTFLAEAKANPDTAGCFADVEDEHFKVVESAWSINFFADGVKWYSEYSDVKSHEELLKLAEGWIDDGNDAIGYFFLRIGEELNDIDEMYGGNWDCDWIRVSRAIEVDWQ